MNAADLTTLAHIKGWLNSGSNADDALLARLITAESNVILKYLGVNIAQQSYTEVRDGSGAGQGLYEMTLTNFPVTAVASLTINDAAVPLSTDGAVLQTGYAFDAARIWLNGYRFTRGRGNVVVQYTAGYAATPADIEQACVELVALRYAERNHIGQNSKSLGGETVAYQTRAMTDSILNTLQNYRRVALP
jgi:uncharacterized phiE125 gp8 family phage protein